MPVNELTNQVSRKGRRRGPGSGTRRGAPIVTGGMESNRFKALTSLEVNKIHHAALDVLETIGMADALPTCVELVVNAGGSLTDEGRLLFPRSLVEDVVANANRDFVLYGQDPKHDIHPHGERVYFGTAGAAVEIVDPITREYRGTTLDDLYAIGRIVDVLDHIHFYQRILVPRDLEDAFEMDINTLYAIASATTKHIGTSWMHPDHIRRAMPMLYAIAGGEDKWRERPFVTISNTFVVPPLRFGEDSCACLEVAVQEGMPVILAAAGMAGASSPSALAGAVVQEIAENLAGLVYVNLLKAGHPTIFGIWPLLSDLRNGAMCSGSGEQALLAAAFGQMGRFYDLTTGVAAGMADSKLPDAQSGFEKANTITLAAHSGANIIYEAAGMHASLLGCCYESMVIDNEMLGNINRTIRGIEVNEDTISVEAIRRTCVDGPRHYLGDEQTIKLMQTEYLYPDLADRMSPKEWSKVGSTDIVERARTRVDKILTEHFPAHISPEIDAKIRDMLPIRLPRERMLPDGWSR